MSLDFTTAEFSVVAKTPSHCFMRLRLCFVGRDLDLLQADIRVRHGSWQEGFNGIATRIRCKCFDTNVHIAHLMLAFLRDSPGCLDSFSPGGALRAR